MRSCVRPSSGPPSSADSSSRKAARRRSKLFQSTCSTSHMTSEKREAMSSFV